MLVVDLDEAEWHEQRLALLAKLEGSVGLSLLSFR
jgi:hypothetical protein